MIPLRSCTSSCRSYHHSSSPISLSSDVITALDPRVVVQIVYKAMGGVTTEAQVWLDNMTITLPNAQQPGYPTQPSHEPFLTQHEYQKDWIVFRHRMNSYHW